MNVLMLALRSLRREWHLPELRTLAASLVLAVVALGVVATLAARIERGLLASAAELIGGDVGISAPQALPARWSQRSARPGPWPALLWSKRSSRATMRPAQASALRPVQAARLLSSAPWWPGQQAPQLAPSMPLSAPSPRRRQSAP